MTETAAGFDTDEATAIRQSRREHRVDTSWLGLIRLPEGKELPCVVRDISKSGAKLSIPIGIPLAKTFLLKVEERGFAFAVSLMWRRGGHAGVRISRMVKIAVGGAAAASTNIE